MMGIKKDKKETPLGVFDTKKEPRKSLQTYLRNQNKLYVNSFNIIDRKAAIMIRVNSTIISAIFIFFSKVEAIDNGFAIGLTMVVASFFSLMFALNASRPHSFNQIFRFKRNQRKRNIKPEELVFVAGASADMSIEEYEEAFYKIVKDQKLQIGNQVKAMHMFEKNVRNAFIHIEISYIAFMLGFVGAVALFVIGCV